MAKNSTLVAIVVVAVVLVLGMGALFMFAPGSNLTITGAGTGDTGGTCEIAPTIAVNAIDAAQKGTSVTVGTNARVNDVYVGSVPASLAKGDTVELIHNATNYIDVISAPITVDCGVNRVVPELYATDASTLSIKDDSSTVTDSATGGATNFSGIAEGGTDTARVFITGIDKKSTGDIVYVVEMSVNTNVSSITMTDAVGVPLATTEIPEFYVRTLSSPEVAAFIIPESVGAVEREFKLTWAAKSGKDIYGAVYTTAYTQQAFVDDDGSFKVGIEDESGDTKYEDTFDYDFWITA